MALTHLVDTSVVKRLKVPAVWDMIEPLVRSGTVARAMITDLEVGYSARSASEWDELQSDLEAFENLPMTAEHVARALQVQRLLAARHQRGRKIPDLLIAAAAERSDLTVLHYDADFDQIAAVTGQRCEWVIPAASID